MFYAKRPDCPVQGWYEGEWSEGKFHGQGKEAYPDGRVYEGQFSQGQKQGSGKMIYQKKPGCRARGFYEGEWANDKFNGFGKEGLPNGNIYEGYFKDGQRHGEGLMEYVKVPGSVADGKYQGDWVEGKYNGRGKEKYKNGNVYEGQFKNDKRHGKGRMEYALRAGAKFEGYYEGEWVNGETNG